VQIPAFLFEGTIKVHREVEKVQQNKVQGMEYILEVNPNLSFPCVTWEHKSKALPPLVLCPRA
jgi:hypothetical protein